MKTWFPVESICSSWLPAAQILWLLTTLPLLERHRAKALARFQPDAGKSFLSVSLEQWKGCEQSEDLSGWLADCCIYSSWEISFWCARFIAIYIILVFLVSLTQLFRSYHSIWVLLCSFFMYLSKAFVKGEQRKWWITAQVPDMSLVCLICS